MRLSEWRAASPSKEAGSPKVAALVDPVLVALGADADPHGWVAWGEEPAVRYTILVPTAAGLISCFVRVNVPGEGPRASAKLDPLEPRPDRRARRSRPQAAHRLLSFQVEQQRPPGRRRRRPTRSPRSPSRSSPRSTAGPGPSRRRGAVAAGGAATKPPAPAKPAAAAKRSTRRDGSCRRPGPRPPAARPAPRR